LVVGVVPGLVDHFLDGFVAAARLAHTAPEREVAGQVDGRARLRVLRPHVARLAGHLDAFLEADLLRLAAEVVHDAPADQVQLPAKREPLLGGGLQ
jgi:hypothetical protein